MMAMMGCRLGVSMALELAMGASAREWPDRLHRHVLDHGGARVVGRMMSVTQCVDTSFDLIFVDDVCSFLTPRLVVLLRQRGRSVVGVYDPADSPDAKRRLLECGISDVIESDATPEEFMSKAVAAVADEFRPSAPLSSLPPRVGRSIGVAGVNDGVGCTEVAVGLAAAVAGTGVAAGLVDLDPVWPSLLQRLDLAPHPNLRTLVDVALHGGEMERALQTVAGVRVAGGSLAPQAQSVPAHEVGMALDALGEMCDVVVSDLGAVGRVPESLLGSFDSIILVAGADPVSLSRLLRSLGRLEELGPDLNPLVAINATPRRPFYKAELRAELAASLDGHPFIFLPFEEALYRAAWDGRVFAGGKFGRELGRIARLLVAQDPHA